MARLARRVRSLATEAERARITRRLRRVERRLRTRDTTALAPEVRAERGRCLDSLRAYREAARYPKNTLVPHHRVPILRDAEGTLCAVAYMMHRSGAGSAVEGLARENNHVRVRDMVDRPFLDWLKRSGITKEEAAEIQPNYDPVLDVSIFSIVLFATYAPFRFAAGILRSRARRAGQAERTARPLLWVALLLAASLGLSLLATIALSPTYGDSRAGPFRITLFITFFVLVFLAESLAALALRRLVSEPRRSDAALGAWVSLANVAIAIVIAPQIAYLIFRTFL